MQEQDDADMCVTYQHGVYDMRCHRHVDADGVTLSVGSRQ